jgi:hypothetical protein
MPYPHHHTGFFFICMSSEVGVYLFSSGHGEFHKEWRFFVYFLYLRPEWGGWIPLLAFIHSLSLA